MLSWNALRIVVLAIVMFGAMPCHSAVLEFFENPKPEFVKSIYIKPGLTFIKPNVKSGPIKFYGLDKTAQLALNEGAYPGTGVDVSSAHTLSMNIGYVLPWGNRHWSIETILAPPIKVEFSTSGVARYESLAPITDSGIPTGIPPLGRELGETMLLPPTLTLVYNFSPDAIYSPYVGVGASYVFSYEEKITNPTLTEVKRPDIEISDPLAWVVQAGINIKIYKNFFANIDVKYFGNATVEAVVDGIALNSDVEIFDPIRINRATVELDLNPLIVQANLGIRF